MSLLSIAAMIVAAAALIGLAFGMPDAWFCGLLALACLLGGLDAAYRELNTTWPLLFLASGAGLCGAALHAIVTGRRERRTR